MQEISRAIVDGSLEAISQRKEHARAEAANPQTRAERRRAAKQAQREVSEERAQYERYARLEL